MADRRTSGAEGADGNGTGPAAEGASRPQDANRCHGRGCDHGHAAGDVCAKGDAHATAAPAELRDLPGGPPVVDTPTYQGPDRRKSIIDRRTTRTGLERRRGPGRRRSDFARSAEEGEMSSEQFLFVMAIDAYKRVNDKPYPTWTEVLEVIRKLGYRKTCPMELGLTNAQDWTEAPDAPTFAATAELRQALAKLADERE